MEVLSSVRPGGELLEIIDPQGRCVAEIRCNDVAYLEQLRALAFSVRPASGLPAASPAVRLLALVRDAG